MSRGCVAILIGLALCAVSCSESRRVCFESSPPGATVFVDGEKIGEAPVVTNVVFPSGGAKSKDPMRIRAVKMQLAGYAPVSKFISYKDVPEPKEPNRIRFTLPPLTFSYRLVLKSTPSGANVFIDDEDTGFTTPCLLERTCRRESRFERPKVALKLRGYEEYWLDVDPADLEANGNIDHHAVMSPE